MTAMSTSPRRLLRAVLAAAVSLLLQACASSLLPAPAAPPALFALESEGGAAAARAPDANAPTLIVNTPRAAAGMDTASMAYLRRPHEIEYFARNQWVDTPANMLAPMIVQAIERTGSFHAVLGAPTSASGQLRLETELLRLQQDFSRRPSQVRLTLRATLVDSSSRKVLASREFDVRVDAPSDDPYGGVIAAQLAAGKLLAELASFCASAAR